LEDICDIQCGYAFKSTDYKDEGVPLVRISNVADPYVDLSENVVFLEPRFLTERSEFVLSKGDVLVALSGATTGKTGTYNSELPALLNQRVGRLRYRADSPVSRSLFNEAFFLFRERILRDAYGAAQPNISPKEFRRYSIFVPMNKEVSAVQEKLVALGNAREAAAAHSRETCAVLGRLLATIFN
jgi:type I restriction enzyme S subunit